MQINHSIPRMKKKEVCNMRIQELLLKVRTIKENEQLIKELEAETDSLKDDIKTLMTAEQKDELTVDVFTVRYKPVVSNRFDSTAFKATHAELYSQYSKATESRRFTIV